MEWREAAKWFVLMVSAGVVTAIAIEIVTRELQNRAILAARSEIGRLLLSAQSQSQEETQSSNPNSFYDNSGVGYTNIT